MSASVSLDLARRRHPLLSRTVQKAAAAGTERSSLLHARLATMDGTKGAESYEPVSHAPAVIDFSVKSLRCCAAMAGNVLRRNCIVHWVWHSYIT
ncbi:hypothetical protein PVAP13_6KG093406 [Panicum virgatum]|uniref:Uncharacterized protein n=1 Tax=Panicum virgatum TaxID=38727 RepID=A0A8T0RCJ8_PANVG|nr:hypothetical protein PVAP13_6KG093406 [Panicum virgatum]